MTPSGDEWFETEVAPDLIINVEGNFDTVLAENRNSIGTVWNSWETQWSGVVSTTEELSVTGFKLLERTVQTVRTDLRRTGLRTDVVEEYRRITRNESYIKSTYTFCKTKNYKFCWTRVFTQYKTICVF